MADQNYIDRTAETKIVGQDATGTSVNYVSADVNGNMLVKDYSNGPVSPGTAALASSLVGGQYNSSLPTLTTGQQASIQIDSSGRLLVNIVNTSLSVTQGTSPWVVSGTVTSNQGTSPWVTNVSQFGGSAIVTGTGASGSGIPRVTVSNDSNILATQSGIWTVQPGNIANTIRSCLAASQPYRSGCRSISRANTASRSLRRRCSRPVFRCQAAHFAPSEAGCRTVMALTT